MRNRDKLLWNIVKLPTTGLGIIRIKKVLTSMKETPELEKERKLCCFVPINIIQDENETKKHTNCCEGY